jgi:uncharacterized protein (DUF433 family)
MENTTDITRYQYLEGRPGSLCRQPFIKGTRIRAEIPYGYTVDKEDEEEGISKGQSPGEVAGFLRVPLDAVLEAIDYCQKHWDVVICDHAREDRLMEAHGMNHPDHKWNPTKYYRPITPEERARIINDEDLPR